MSDRFSVFCYSVFRLSLFSHLSRVKLTLVDREMNAGIHQATFDAGSYPSGAYIYRLEVNNFVEVKKMMLVMENGQPKARMRAIWALVS